MGLFENFPYTNFHNLNLDWIIKVLKNAVAELEEIQTNWEGVRDTANTAKTTADAAATKAENARITANGAMTKAVTAEDTAKAAKTQAEGAELVAYAAQNTSVEAQATANEANETAARAENTAGVAQSTANAAKTTADGVDAKASTALTNSQQATEIATEADSTANAANKKAVNADSKVNALTTTVNTVGKTANDALSLAQTNETDIASNDADITEIRKFITAPVETLMQPGGYFAIAAGDTNYNIPEGAESYTQLISITISNDTVTNLTELADATDGDGHKLYRLDYVPRVWLMVNDIPVDIPAIAARSGGNTFTIAATSNIAYATTDGGLHYALTAVCDLVGINTYTSIPTQ